MKKVLFLILASIMSGIFYAKPALAGASIDASFTSGTGSKLIDTSVRTYQTFSPTFSILDKVETQIVNQGGNYKLNCSIKIYQSGTWNVLNNCGTEVIIAAGTNWHVFDFENFNVTVGQEYAIFLSAAPGGSGSYHLWKYSETQGTYAAGYATWHDTHYNQGDFNFKTWGLDPTEIVEEQTNPGSDQTPEQTGITPPLTTATATTSNEAPTVTTTTSIAKPTALKGEYLAGVKLTWMASTTADIDGYLIFRSETKGKSYIKVGQTTKAVLEYTDATGMASTTFYYVVRAYKGASQSVNSNEASIIIPANAAPITPLNFTVKNYGSDYITADWDKNPEANISEYTITILQGNKEIEKATVLSANTSYLFNNLIPETEYTITLSAKNSDGKESAPASLIQKTKVQEVTASYANKFEMSTLTWILLGAAILLTITLVFIDIKRRKAKKNSGQV